MKSVIRTLSLFLIAGTAVAYADTASILPPAKTTFVDQNGKPLTSGTVDFYSPSTTTRKATWQDAGETILNTNPVVLDAAGRGLILGSGSYRQVVKDRLGNIIWDQVTSSTGSSSTPSAATGDGDLVGTMKPWAGLIAPNQYSFSYGQEVSRTTYPLLFSTLTSVQATFCTSGSPILSGLSDTNNFPIGGAVEISCIASGNSTIIAKTSTTVTLAANANITTNTTATFLPWGGGNHTNTFNLPDFRGISPVGNNIMGGVASTHTNTTDYSNIGANPNSIGALGGSSKSILITSNLPAYTPLGTITNGAIASTFTGLSGQTGLTGSGGAQAYAGGGFASSQITGIVSSPQATSTFAGTAQGGTSASFINTPPSTTINFIIKVTPDTNSATASGVTSLGGMVGDIACGSGLTCSSNTISTIAPPTVYNGNIVYVESCGAVGNGIADDTAAIRTCAAGVGANPLGGIVAFSCNATYLLNSYGTPNGALLTPYSNVTYQGCGESSVVKVGNGLNTVSAQYLVFYPPDATATYTYTNTHFRNFKIDLNGLNNLGFNYTNIGIGILFGSNISVEGVTFVNNPGSQDIFIGTNSAITVSGVNIVQTNHSNVCDTINVLCTDHSSIYIVADDYAITGNVFKNTTQSTKATSIELHGLNGSAQGNSINKYYVSFNIASQSGHTASNITVTGNNSTSTYKGFRLYNDGSSTMRNVVINGNNFRQGFQDTSAPFFDFDQGVTGVGVNGVNFTNNIFYSDVVAGVANSVPTVMLGRGANVVVSNNIINGGLGPCIGNTNGPGTVVSTFTAVTSFTISSNILSDCGQTSTASGKRGILINSATNIDSASFSNNKIENVASAYMTTGFDITMLATYGLFGLNNIVNNVATPITTLTTGFNTAPFNGIIYSQGLGLTPAGTNTANGAMLNTSSAGLPSLTITPTLGVAGTSVGTLSFQNVTSGSIKLSPSTGALGSSILTLPIATDTLIGKATTDILTNKTYDTAGTGNSFLINGLAATANTGTGSVVRATSPSVSGLTVTGSFTATGLVTNAALANPATTVNGQTCTLGSTCTVTAAASSITTGTTTISGGATTRVLFNNAGILGEYVISGTGNVAMTTSPVFTTPNLGTPSALVATNATGTASGLTAGTVTTNANLTGVITSSGNATSITSQTGTGTKFVVDTSPTVITPTFTTSATFPLHIGGTGTTSTLTLQPTSGAGTTGANIIFKGGNNGATTWGTWQDGGFLTIGSTATTSDLLSINGAANQGISIFNGSSSVRVVFRWNTSVGGYFQLYDTVAATSISLFGAGTSDQYFAPTGNGAFFGFNTTTPQTVQSGNVSNAALVSNGPIKHAVNTFANRPTCNAAAEGSRYGVTDGAAAPLYSAAAAGGGTVHTAIYCNGTTWVNM